MTTMTTKLKEIVQKVEKQFPGAWKKAAQARNERGKSLLGWPNWCYLPMDVWVNVARDTHAANVVQELHPSSLIESLAAVGAWRITKSVYRFDPDIFREIVDTPVDGNLPCEIVRRLPEWCLFIETPGFEWGGASIDGFFAHLHKCRCCGEEALQLLIVAGDTLVSQSVSLGGWTLLEGIERSFLKDPHYIFGLMPEEEKLRRTNASSLLVAPLLSLLLYICSTNAEIGNGATRPRNPSPVKISGGREKILPAETPRIWNVGERTGNAIRRGRQQSTFSGRHYSSGEGSPKRPHIRRAHWHGYWTGPRTGNQKYEVKWLPPTPIKVDNVENLPVVNRPVEEGRRSA